MKAAQNVAAAALITGLVAVSALVAAHPPVTPTGCVRKVHESDDCQRLIAPMGRAPTPVDPGLLNHFPAVQSVGGDCEPVACGEK